jgi:hypothetical protein
LSKAGIKAARAARGAVTNRPISSGRYGAPRPFSSYRALTPKHFRFIWQKSGKEVASEAQAILALDGAGYNAATGLGTPDNITTLPLPSYSPELNPMENVWEYLRQNKLAITAFNDCGHIVDNRCVLEFLRRR